MQTIIYETVPVSVAPELDGWYNIVWGNEKGVAHYDAGNGTWWNVPRGIECHWLRPLTVETIPTPHGNILGSREALEWSIGEAFEAGDTFGQAFSMMMERGLEMLPTELNKQQYLKQLIK